MFPIKYIENNMILNQQGEWWAYYELIRTTMLFYLRMKRWQYMNGSVRS